MYDDHVIGLVAAVIVALFTALTFLAKAWASIRTSVDTSQTLKTSTVHLAHEVEVLIHAHNAFQEKGWGTLPDDIASSSGLTAVIRDIQHEVHTTKTTQADILKRLDHIQKTIDQSRYNY